MSEAGSPDIDGDDDENSGEHTADEPLMPWAPLVEPPEIPDRRPPATDPGRTESPSPQDPLRTLGPSPVGPLGLPIFGPGSIPPIWRRGVARVIDTLLIAVPGIVLIVLLWTDLDPESVEDIPVWTLLALRGALVIYNAVLIGLWGTTLGKRIMDLRVENPAGAKPGIQRALLRELLPGLVALVPFVGLAIAIAVYLAAEWTELRQHPYDRAAGTLVVATR